MSPQEFLKTLPSILPYMDEINAIIARVLLIEQRCFELKDELVESVLEDLRAQGYSIRKSALHERFGNKRHHYRDGQWFVEAMALMAMDQGERIKHATLVNNRAKMRFARYVLREDTPDRYLNEL